MHVICMCVYMCVWVGACVCACLENNWFFLLSAQKFFCYPASCADNTYTLFWYYYSLIDKFSALILGFCRLNFINVVKVEVFFRLPQPRSTGMTNFRSVFAI